MASDQDRRRERRTSCPAARRGPLPTRLESGVDSPDRGHHIAEFSVNDDGGTRLRSYLQVPAGPGEYDVAVALRRLCEVVSGELDLLAVSVILLSGPGTETPVAYSADGHQPLDHLHLDLGEGPVLDAFESGRPVLESDLTSALGRWPGFAQSAAHAGVRATFAFPLSIGAVRLGVLALYSGPVRTLKREERSDCLIYADLATELLLDAARAGSGDGLAPGLESLLDLRTEVYQAQGMVMADLGIDLAEALSRLRATAFAESRSLNDLAADVVSRRRRISRDAP